VTLQPGRKDAAGGLDSEAICLPRLHTLGFFGRVDLLPDEDELSLMTMCGHGLVSVKLIRNLLKRIGAGEITPEIAAQEIAKPCVCGIVNTERAAEIFQRIAKR
jgi:hypothetical protein